MEGERAQQGLASSPWKERGRSKDSHPLHGRREGTERTRILSDSRTVAGGCDGRHAVYGMLLMGGKRKGGRAEEYPAEVEGRHRRQETAFWKRVVVITTIGVGF